VNRRSEGQENTGDQEVRSLGIALPETRLRVPQCCNDVVTLAPSNTDHPGVLSARRVFCPHPTFQFPSRFVTTRNLRLRMILSGARSSPVSVL